MPAHALAAPMGPIIALTAHAALVLAGEPFHAWGPRGRPPCRCATSRRHCAPRSRADPVVTLQILLYVVMPGCGWAWSYQKIPQAFVHAVRIRVAFPVTGSTR